MNVWEDGTYKTSEGLRNACKRLVETLKQGQDVEDVGVKEKKLKFILKLKLKKYGLKAWIGFK
jgi:hypothetical protein